MIVLLVFIHTTGYSQEPQTSTISDKEDIVLKEQNPSTEIDTEKFQGAIGTFILEEANFELQIIQEDTKMYVISPFSKDILIQKNDTTLREPTRGVDLELIENDTSGLKFSQNGYVTTIKRVTSK